MPMLLVPPTGAAGSDVVFIFFSFLCLILCGFRFIYISLFLLLISLMKGVVWRGWMTSLRCLFRIV